jgi:metal-dependent amidase/aminoacylase/carboxypeptidase family protein
VSNYTPSNRIPYFLQAITAEEGGSGKVKMLDAGAYEGMAACLMYVVISSDQSRGVDSSC